jgi:hypothetical protein
MSRLGPSLRFAAMPQYVRSRGVSRPVLVTFSAKKRADQKMIQLGPNEPYDCSHSAPARDRSKQGRVFEPRLRHEKSPFPGNVFLRARDKGPKCRPSDVCAVSETKREHRTPANPGPFASCREMSANLGLRGGAERTRTFDQTIMSPQVTFCANPAMAHYCCVSGAPEKSLKSPTPDP